MLDTIKTYFYRWQAQRKCAGGKAPAAYCHYREQAMQIDLNQLVSQTRFVVFDNESTGLNPRQDKIISIGAVAVEGKSLSVADSYESNVFQEFERGRESIEIHGIRRTELLEERPEKDVVLEFLKYVGGSVLVAHHAWFDTRILHYTMRRCWGVPLLSPSLDTLHLAKRVEQNSSAKGGDYTLDALAERYDIRILHRHKAAGDALVTAELLIKLIRKAEKRGITKLGDLLASRES